MPTSSTLRNHVVNLLTVRQAHCTFEDAVVHMPSDRRGERPEELPYSVWELVGHLRRAQRDILDYCRDPNYAPHDWPDDYWPDATAPLDEATWTDSLTQVRSDRDALCELVSDETIDLHDTVPSSDEHTYLREAMLVADHNAYHIGQIVTVRRQLGLWPPGGDTE